MGRPVSDSLSVAVIEAISEVEGVDPLDLEFRLHDYVDTEALDGLGRHDGAAWELQFRVDDHAVSVDSDGSIVVDGQVFRR